jgi:2,3-bisphosphoglycerate-independent phosphoglycerate mutase
MPNEKIPMPVVLVVLDGWGLGEKNRSNAIAVADLPTFRKLDEFYPHVALQASGISVGLPWGEPGNSEVGHMTMGAGKVIYQNMPRITMAIQDGEFFKNPVFLGAVNHAKSEGKALHIMGLVSKGSVHSSLDHLYALLELMKNQEMEKVYLHAFTDGRDSATNSGIEVLKEIKNKMEKIGVGKIATVSGRYFAMDRNNNWDRIEKAYNTIVRGAGNKAEDPELYLKSSYAKEIYDEYIEPATIMENGKPIATIEDGDSVIFFNYREDRARQISEAFVVPGFSKFPVEKFQKLYFATMTQYEEDLPVEIAFPLVKVDNCLGKVLSENKFNQLRIAETEKFAHVTYFFNVGNEETFPNEDRVIVPSKNVSSFDKCPEMSAEDITDKVLFNLEKKKYNFILINFANADIVGHTGNEAATIKAAETIDECMKRLIPAVLSAGGCLLITADHGNAEEMINTRTGEKDTEHSSNPVPLWYITNDNHSENSTKGQPMKVSGLLSDIAPTILDILKIKKPEDMTGESLLPILK